MMSALFNAGSAEFIQDPYRFYRLLRQTSPYFRSPMGFVAVSREKDIRAILADKRFGRDFQGLLTQKVESPTLREPVIRSMRHWMLVLDPPDHPRIRGLVSRVFAPRRIQEMRSQIQRVVDETLDGLAGRRSADLISEFAYVIPQRVICDFLGIPNEERSAFLANTDALIRLLDPVSMSRAEMDYANNQNRVLSQYFHQLFERRRREPVDDLTTQLVQAEEQGDRLSEEELTANMILMFTAGFETTANMIGNGLLALFRHPGELARLKGDPSLITGAVEEFLRYDSSVQFTTRTAMEDVTLEGFTFPKSKVIVLLLGSANRDPNAYEQPDRLDIMRKNVRPFSFGAGIHHCLGNQLARLEVELAIGSLIRRFPDVAALDPGSARFRPTMALRGLIELPATLQGS